MSRTKRILLWVMGGFYIAAGVNHFVNPAFYLNIMPPYLPWHEALVLLSGIAEVVLGVAVLVPPLRRVAAWGIIVLLVAIFPANLHQAWNDVPMLGTEQSLGVWRWVRLPLQGVLILWAWWYTRDDPWGSAS